MDRAWKCVSISLAALLAASLVGAFLLLRGCRERPKPNAGPKRTMDPEYIKELGDVHDEQRKLAGKRHEAVKALEPFLEKARAALPAGAADAQVKAELDAHPEKYPGWAEAYAGAVQASDDLEKNLEQAQRTVRAHILKESGSKRKR